MLEKLNDRSHLPPELTRSPRPVRRRPGFIDYDLWGLRIGVVVSVVFVLA